MVVIILCWWVAFCFLMVTTFHRLKLRGRLSHKMFPMRIFGHFQGSSLSMVSVGRNPNLGAESHFVSVMPLWSYIQFRNKSMSFWVNVRNADWIHDELQKVLYVGLQCYYCKRIDSLDSVRLTSCFLMVSTSRPLDIWGQLSHLESTTCGFWCLLTSLRVQ